MHCIYIYRKKETGQVVYVGQTCNVSERRKQHEKDEPFNNLRAEYNYPLSRAIRKYGAEAFEFEILENELSLEEANTREDYWIEYYNSDNPKYGYNNTKGGDGVSNPNILTIIKKRITHAKKYNKRLNNISKKNGWGNLVKNEKEHGLVFLLKRESEYKNTSILHCKMCGIMYTRRNGGKGGFCDYCQKYKKHYKYIKKILK